VNGTPADGGVGSLDELIARLVAALPARARSSVAGLDRARVLEMAAAVIGVLGELAETLTAALADRAATECEDAAGASTPPRRRVERIELGRSHPTSPTGAR